jgi:hypothetical protein
MYDTDFSKNLQKKNLPDKIGIFNLMPVGKCSPIQLGTSKGELGIAKDVVIAA